MKKVLAALLVFTSVVLSACKDQEAREYAAKLISVLDSYQEQLSQKIKAEQESYEEFADNYESARKDSIIDNLAKERLTRSLELGEEIASAKNTPSLSKILEKVLDYGNEDFKITQALLQEGLDARSRYLTELESLEVELQRIKLLKESLKELAKSKKDFKQFKEASDFLLKADSEINKLLCADLKKELEELQKEESDAKDAEKKKITDKINRLRERMATKKCP